MKRALIGILLVFVALSGWLVAHEVSSARQLAVIDADGSAEGDAAHVLGRWHATFGLRERRFLRPSRELALFQGVLDLRELRAPSNVDSVQRSVAQLAAVLYANLESMPGQYPDTMPGWASVGPSGNLYVTLGRDCSDCGNLIFELRPTRGQLRGSWMRESLAHAWDGPAVLTRP